ncbi:MAG: RDD family protein [Pedosphaera sp.]|nr:RDD family protein [Pedosphaera sp.]
MSKTNTLLIRTPEGVVFSQLLAGPVTRFLAWVLDFFCVLVVLMVVNIILSFAMVISMDMGVALLTLAFFVISIGYGIALEWWWRGQTLGKRVLRLRVVDAGGLRLHFHQIVLRNLLRFVDSLPFFYLVGGIACLVSRRAQRLGDLAANTVVIRIPRLVEPDLEQILAGKFNSLRAHPHLEARLRQRVSPAEAAAALQAITRRDEFEPVARLKLFSELSGHFRAKVEFPAEAVEGIADEQHVRNVVDVSYRPRAADKK